MQLGIFDQFETAKNEDFDFLLSFLVDDLGKIRHQTFTVWDF